MSSDDLETIALGRHFAGDRPDGAVAQFSHHSRGARCIIVRYRFKPAMSREKDATLCKRDGVTVHRAQFGERRASRCEQAQMNRYAQFAVFHHLDAGAVQRLERDPYRADDRVLDRYHTVLGISVSHAGDCIREGATGNRSCSVWPLLADRELAEGTQLTLKGDAWNHGSNILTWQRARRSLHGMTRHRSARYWYFTPTRMGSGVFGVRD